MLKKVLIFAAGMLTGAAITALATRSIVVKAKHVLEEADTRERAAKWRDLGAVVNQGVEEGIEVPVDIIIEESKPTEEPEAELNGELEKQELYDENGNTVVYSPFTVVGEERADYYTNIRHFPTISAKFYPEGILVDEECDDELNEPALVRFLSQPWVWNHEKFITVVDEIDSVQWSVQKVGYCRELDDAWVAEDNTDGTMWGFNPSDDSEEYFQIDPFTGLAVDSDPSDEELHLYDNYGKD